MAAELTDRAKAHLLELMDLRKTPDAFLDPELAALNLGIIKALNDLAANHATLAGIAGGFDIHQKPERYPAEWRKVTEKES
jgi:hypothetical protein